jgi:hypothetical protein
VTGQLDRGFPWSQSKCWVGTQIPRCTAKYGYRFWATRTIEWLYCKLQTRCVVRGRPTDTRPQISDSNIPIGSNIWSQVPQGCSIPRHIDWLTVSRKVISTLTLNINNYLQVCYSWIRTLWHHGCNEIGKMIMLIMNWTLVIQSTIILLQNYHSKYNCYIKSLHFFTHLTNYFN